MKTFKEYVENQNVTYTDEQIKWFNNHCHEFVGEGDLLGTYDGDTEVRKIAANGTIYFFEHDKSGDYIGILEGNSLRMALARTRGENTLQDEE